MPTAKLPLELTTDSTIHINRNAWVQQIDDMRVVLVQGVPLCRYDAKDRHAEALAMANLSRAGLAKATQLARVFGKSRNTVAAYNRRLEQGGVAELVSLRRGPKGAHKIKASLERTILNLKSQGLANTQIAARLGVSDMSVGRLLKRKGWSQSNVRPQPLPGMQPASAVFKELPIEANTSSLPRAVREAVEPRTIERALAAVGLIQQADTRLVSGRDLRCLGALVAIPLLMETRLLEVAERVYGRMRNGFYGLTSTMLTLFLMALLRIKRPEGLKRQPPEILGRLLGLDRSPEVKTLRRKLRELGQRCLAHEFLRAIARRIADQHKDVLGYLYVDGHVRLYHGDRKIPKVFSQKRQMVLPATTDYWVNDANGDPFFFITTEGNAFLNRAFPRVLEEVRDTLGSRPITFVFDRGGWSAELFRTLRSYGYDFITYRKQRYRNVPRSAFERHVLCENGKQLEYWLADRSVRLKGYGRVRCVAQLDKETGHQTHVVTTREDLSREEVTRRMFRRWRQENFFKYMMENYALDALVSYDMEPADPERELSNPAKKQLTSQIRSLRNELSEAHRRLGLLASGRKKPGRTKGADLEAERQGIGEEISRLQQQIGALGKKRRKLPTRIKVRDLPSDAHFRLESERKILMDTVRIVAYRVESALLTGILPHYSHAEQEGRQLIQEILQASGDLEVREDTVTVTLEPLGSPHRTRVLEKLCECLTEQRCKYPGTIQHLTYQVRGCTTTA
jgi:Transposase protein